MKIRNSARSGIWISIIILIIALSILLMLDSVPNENINILSEPDKWRSALDNNKVETPIWKIVCYIIVGILMILSAIVNFVMCRCHNCGRHINVMGIFTMYCPYCSKSLDTKK